MGDRGQVHIVDEGIWLYTHWGATELVNTVAKILSRRLRWGDPEYLTRMIFQEMLGDDKSELGYGIGSKQHWYIWRIVEVDVSEQKVIVRETNKDKVEWSGSFEDFVNSFGQEKIFAELL